MNALTELEFLILDEVYFVSSYHTILKNLGCEEEQFRKTLINLLEKAWIAQLKYNEEKKDFEKLDAYEISFLEASSFVATKEGLLIHNSRNWCYV